MTPALDPLATLLGYAAPLGVTPCRRHSGRIRLCLYYMRNSFYKIPVNKYMATLDTNLALLGYPVSFLNRDGFNIAVAAPIPVAASSSKAIAYSARLLCDHIFIAN